MIDMTVLPPTTWAPDTEPTTQQLADWIGSLDPDERLAWVERFRRTMAMGNRCFQMNHDDTMRGVYAVMSIDPAEFATTSRDYGRGFAEALRRVKERLA